MPDPFDVIPPNFETVLREDCFSVVSIMALVAQEPAKNAHYIAEARGVLDKIEGLLADAGLEGDGSNLPESRQLDVVDMLFLKGAEGLKRYFEGATNSGEEYDDD